MSNLNKVMLIGNLTRDPEIRTTGGGTTVGELGLATNRRVKDGNDGWKDEVTFLNVTVWGKTAENCSKFLQKGRPVFIEGRLQIDTWDDKETSAKRTKLKIVAENVQFLNGGSGGGSSSDSSQRAKETKTQRLAREANEQGSPDDDEDIPF